MVILVRKQEKTKDLLDGPRAPRRAPRRGRARGWAATGRGREAGRRRGRAGACRARGYQLLLGAGAARYGDELRSRHGPARLPAVLELNLELEFLLDLRWIARVCAVCSACAAARAPRGDARVLDKDSHSCR